MKRASSSVVTFGILTLIGVFVAGSIFLISNNLKEDADKEIIDSFSENIFLIIEKNMIQIEKIIELSSDTSEIYVYSKEKIPEKIGQNSYTIIGKNNEISFNSQNYGFTKTQNILWSNLNLTGLSYSGNREMRFMFNSSKSNTSIQLY